MSDELKDRIVKAVAAGRAARGAYYDAIELPDEQALGPPAPEAKLVELEERLGVPLPPSYRTFLSLHDGWRMALGAVDLLSAEEILDGPRSEKIRTWQAEAEAADDTLAAESLVIGYNEASSIKILLDPNTTDDDGEWAVVGHDDGPEWSYPSVLAWLEASVDDFHELAEDEVEGDGEGDDEDDDDTAGDGRAPA